MLTDFILPHLPVIQSWLSSITLSMLTYGFPSLAVPTDSRRQQAERDLLALSHLSSAAPLPNSFPLVASDASMQPSPISPLAFRSVTFASASPTSSFRGTLANYGRSASILHGELYGILLAILLATSSSPSKPLPIYSDHLNAVTLLNDALQHPPAPHFWSSLPARSLYKWILMVLRSSPQNPSLLHVRAHTSASDPASLANRHVDHLASSSHSLPIPPPPVPVPTFSMDKFTPHLPSFQYIESNLPQLLHSLLASRTFSNPSFVPLSVLSPFFYDSHSPPLHPYTQASSSFSAVVQLYTRSGQLPTNLSMATRFRDRLMLCRFGCPSIEDPHHIFVHCPLFQPLRDEYSANLLADTRRILTKSTLPNPTINHLVCVASHLFQDDPSWPIQSSRFYLGLSPPLLPPTNPLHTLSTESQRCLTRLAHSFHIHAIRLAARIWGMVIRHHTSTTSNGSSEKTRESLLRGSHLSLPPHLHYLLHL